jgi:hypothetical protein
VITHLHQQFDYRHIAVIANIRDEGLFDLGHCSSLSNPFWSRQHHIVATLAVFANRQCIPHAVQRTGNNLQRKPIAALRTAPSVFAWRTECRFSRPRGHVQPVTGCIRIHRDIRCG